MPGTTTKIVLAISGAVVLTGANVGIHMWFRHHHHPHHHHGHHHGHDDERRPDSTPAKLYTVPSVEELKEFEAFEKEYERKYADENQRFLKFEIFRENRNFIEKYNGNPKNTATLKMNQFGDVHHEDFKRDRLGLDLGLKMETTNFARLGTHEPKGIEVPDSVDWVEKGGVTPVKNQQACGSCWSFSTTGALEGAYFARHGTLVSLSEQEFVDCDTQDNGCNGGLMDNAFQYAMTNDLCTEESYAYHAEEGKCQMAKKKCQVAIKQGQVTGFKDVAPHSQQALMEALAQQPVSIAIEADKQVFQFYHKGVLTNAECGTELDHGVLAVGYGTYTDPDTGATQKFWKVKNSWGPSWGVDGYIRISRDDNQDDAGNNVGVCGIMTLPSYPVLSTEGEGEKTTPAKTPAKIDEVQTAQEQLYV